MNTQEAYEHIREYFSRPDAVLAKEGEGAGLRCFYRMPDGTGNACAVGCLIPDDLYNLADAALRELDGEDSLYPGIENRSFDQLVEACAELKHKSGALADLYELLNNNNQKETFLSCAQSLHDDADDPITFVDGLDYLARQYGLTVAN